MAMFPDSMPRPTPNMDEQGFWDACAQQALRFQACGSCGTLRHPPLPICGACHSTAIRWVDAPAEAELFSYTVVHHASHPAVKGNLPYVVGIVSFPGLPGVRLVSNITGVERTDVRIGMKLRLWWDDIGAGMYVPRFAAA
ncbi:MAG: OB-fold domain-containing protein [Pseudomonadota bacterium]|nr:OB-fold domain-containing protein [Pseudomonadota bacterium]